MFEIERVRDRERKVAYSLHKGTETLVRDRERFEIERVNCSNDNEWDFLTPKTKTLGKIE